MTIETRGTIINKTGNEFLEKAIRGGLEALLGRMLPGTANGHLGVMCVSNEPETPEEAVLFSFEAATGNYTGNPGDVPATLKYLSETSCAIFNNGFSVVYKDDEDGRNEKWCFAFDGNTKLGGIFTVNAFNDVITAMHLQERAAHGADEAKAVANSISGLIEAIMNGDAESAFEKFECPFCAGEIKRKNPAAHFDIDQIKASEEIYFVMNLMMPDMLTTAERAEREAAEA